MSEQVFQQPLIINDSIAVFSSCRRYRYTLWRGIGAEYVQFIGLNPSTADEVKDDQTIRKCTRFVQLLGYSRFCMTNLFSYRATVPSEMKKATFPVGEETDKWLLDISSKAALVIAAWGVHGTFLSRDKEVIQMLPNLHCFGFSKNGSPLHPLMLPYTTKIEKFENYAD